MALVFGFVLLNFSAHKDTVDFSEFYGAAQMVREGLGAKLYDLEIQIQFQLRVAAVHAFYLRPPFEALLFIPFTYIGYASAYALWTLVGLGTLAAATALIESSTQVRMAITKYTGVRADLGLLLVVFLTFAPTTTCLSIGQDSIVLLFIYAAAFVLLRRGEELQSGCLLACGLFKFHLIVPFVLILLLRKKWRAIGGFLIIASVLIVISIAVSGSGALLEYPRVLLFNHTHWQLMGFQPGFTPNIRGFLYLLTTGKLPTPMYGTLIAIVSAMTLWWSAKNWREEQFDLSFAAAVLATLLASFHLYTYDLTVLLLPITITCGKLAERGAPFQGKAALNAVLLVLFLPPVHFFLLTQKIYALMFLPIFVLFLFVLRLMNSDAFPQTKAFQQQPAHREAENAGTLPDPPFGGASVRASLR